MCSVGVVVFIMKYACVQVEAAKPVFGGLFGGKKAAAVEEEEEEEEEEEVRAVSL
jgi:hypothetical protein